MNQLHFSDPALLYAPSPESHGVRKWFNSRGWEPFAFQLAAWEAYLSGKSGLIHVPTGEGMTYAACVGADVSARAVIDRFMFDVEILLLTRRLGHEIREIGVAWDNPTESTLNVSRDLPQMLGDLFTTTWRLRVKRGLPPVVETAAQKGAATSETAAAEMVRQ